MPTKIVTIMCRGRLTHRQLEAELFVAESAFVNAESTMTLVVDCLEMTGYDKAARTLFVEWNAAHRDVISQVVVLTDKQLHKMVITAMALASSQNMRVLNSRAEWERLSAA